MRYKNVCLEEFGYYLLTEVLTSLEVEKRMTPLYEKLDLEFGRLEALSGIRERRIMPRGTYPSGLATKAAEKILENRDRSKVEALFYAGVCRDYTEPATAAIVHHNLRLSPDCMLFDISNACVGFLNSVLTAANMIELGQIKSAMIVSAENPGPVYEDTVNFLLQPENMNLDTYRENIASFTLGGGAVALWLTHRDETEHGHFLRGGLVQTATHAHSYCKGSADAFQQKMETNTKELMRAGLEVSSVAWELFKKEMDWQESDITKYATHQVSLQHRMRLFELLQLNLDKDYPTYQILGNTGSVAAPMALALAAEEGFVNKGDRVGWLGFGSGINALMLGVEW